MKVCSKELERFKLTRYKVNITRCVQFYASSVMGDVFSTNLSNFQNNLNDIFTSPDWSPPSAIYSNFNFSTWTIPSFPAVPSGNQVRKKISFRKYVLSFLKWAFSGNTSSFAAVEYRVSFLRLVQANQFMDLSQYNDSRRKTGPSEKYKHSSIIQSKQF